MQGEFFEALEKEIVPVICVDRLVWRGGGGGWGLASGRVLDSTVLASYIGRLILSP